MIRAGQTLSTLTLDQAKTTIVAHFPGVFDTSIPLSERVDVIIPCDEELLYLFQSVEVFSAIGHDDWSEFRSVSQDVISSGFMLLYNGRTNDCKVLISEQLRRVTAEISLQQFTFSRMRDLNGLIPSRFLITGRRTELYFSHAKLTPKDRPDLCRLYYCLSVYEEFKSGMMRPEELNLKLENIFSISMAKNLSNAIYSELLSSTPTEFVRFMDALVIPVAGDVVSNEFQDPFGLLRFFNAFIKTCLQKWSNRLETKIYAPCTAICQSSGFGKTKLVLESGQHHFHIIYLCLRDEHSPSRLKRTPVAADLFCKEVREEEQQQLFSKIYISIFKSLVEFIEEGLVDPSAANITDNIMGMTADHRQSTHQPFWQRVGEVFELEDGESDAERSLKYLKLLKDAMTQRGRLRPIVFVIDEARPLVEKSIRFKEWRHSIMKFTDGDIFFLVLNSSSRLFDFVPAARQDSSPEVASGDAMLLPPFYWFPIDAIDVVPNPDSTILVPFGNLTNNNQRLAINHADLISLCRAMFVQCFKDEEDPTKAWEVAVALAELMLCGAHNLESTADRKKFGLLATLLARIVSILVDSLSGDTLVEFHIGTILGVSEDRSIVRIGYPIEPVVSEAAGRITMDDQVWNSGVSELRTLVVSGRSGHCSGKGDRGEMVVMLALLRAHDVTHRRASVRDLSLPVTVLNFLETLLGGIDFSAPKQMRGLLANVETSTITNISDRLLDGLLSYTKWKRVDKTITQDILRCAFKERLAIQCMATNEGVDLIIPVALPTEDAEGSIQSIDSVTMGGIFVQVKNRADSVSSAVNIAASLMRNAKKAFGGSHQMPPILGIVWQVGGILSGAPRLIGDEDESVVLLNGLSWCDNFLSSQAIENLKEIAVGIPFVQPIIDQMREYGGEDMPVQLEKFILSINLDQ